MSEITLKAIERLLDETLDAKLQPIKSGLAKMATQDGLDQLSHGLTSIEEILHLHTSALDNLAKDVKLLLDEKTISAARLDRLEKWAHDVGEKIGVRLDLDNLPLLKN